MKTMISALLLVWASMSQASELVTLKDGRQIQINNDFTWQYAQPQKKQAIEAVTKSTPAVVAAPIVQPKIQGTTVDLSSNKPLLQLSDSGVDVVLNAANYSDGELVIPTAITNQSRQSVIQVQIQWSLYDEQGNRLQEGNNAVWQSIKRMGDTYLRPQTAADGKALHIAVPSHNRYQLKATISAVETR